MRSSFAGRLGNSTQSLKVLFFRHDLLERGAQFIGLEFLAELFELLEGEPTFVLQPLLIIVFLDHLTHFVARHFETANVQSVSQLGNVDETISIRVNLSEKRNH
ncbi:hypothetical protein ALC57_07630 [Trachymyrmex cornetzi]|uniref:Uncharacterized protein n=1 Tax=Trachymyrmex cornetzi TaxID=471704 RepID=A0A151J7R7_9HYME|nr:hypothetical protein ALC57_07630 [Trachymyrmex cornetzi]